MSFYTKTVDWRSQSLFGGFQFTFWRVPIYILEGANCLGVLYRKGVIPKKGGTLGSRDNLAHLTSASSVTDIFPPRHVAGRRSCLLVTSPYVVTQLLVYQSKKLHMDHQA